MVLVIVSGSVEIVETPIGQAPPEPKSYQANGSYFEEEGPILISPPRLAP